jgi:hypothetical protein
MNTENGTAIFRSHNRYEAMYPGIRAVSQPTLHVIKRLRAAGVRVRIEPEDERPLCFTFQRGIGEWLADPAVALLASVPVSFAVTICCQSGGTIEKGGIASFPQRRSPSS